MSEQNQQETQALARVEKNPFVTLFSKYRQSIAQSLPQHLRVKPELVDKFIRLAATMVATNPKLSQCTPQSLIMNVMKAAQYGLELGVRNQGWLVPFSNHGKMEAVLVTGYEGMCKMARNSGEIKDIRAYVVHEHDTFTIEYGLEDKVHHVPTMRGDPGEAIGVWIKAVYASGMVAAPLFMTRAQVEKVRAKSKSPDSLMWSENFEEGMKKTIVRNYLKLLPYSMEVQETLDRENEIDSGNRPSVDVEGFVVEEEATEQPTQQQLANASAQSLSEDKMPSVTQRVKEQREKQAQHKEKKEPAPTAPTASETVLETLKEKPKADVKPQETAPEAAAEPIKMTVAEFKVKFLDYLDKDAEIVATVMKEQGYKNADDLPSGSFGMLNLLEGIEDAFKEKGGA